MCGAKTRLQLLRKTELKAFPLFCPKCKCESIIDAKNFIIEAKKKVYPGTEVIYMSCIMASSVKGYAEAAKRYHVCAVCAVGMGQTGTQTDVVRKKNHIPTNIPLFTLQGNFDVAKLRGAYRLMMEIMVKTAGKGLADKPDRTPEEDDMLDMMLHSGNRVSIDNLGSVLDWYRTRN